MIAALVIFGLLTGMSGSVSLGIAALVVLAIGRLSFRITYRRVRDRYAV